MTKIDSTKLLDGVWQIVYDSLISTSYGVTDTHSPVRTRSSFIFSAFPEKGKNISNWCGYPVIVVHPPSIGGGNLTLHKQKRNIECSVQIDVFDRSNKNCKTLADNVINILDSRQIEARRDYLGNFRLGSTDCVTDFINKQRTHRITIIVQYDYQR